MEMKESYFWFDFPEEASESWYKLHRHLSGGPLMAAAVMNRWRSEWWHSAYKRRGDEWFIPLKTGSVAE